MEHEDDDVVEIPLGVGKPVEMIFSGDPSLGSLAETGNIASGFFDHDGLDDQNIKIEED